MLCDATRESGAEVTVGVDDLVVECDRCTVGKPTEVFYLLLLLDVFKYLQI